MQKRVFYFLTVIFFTFFLGCVPSNNLIRRYQSVEKKLNYSGTLALEELLKQKKSYSEEDSVLLYLDEGILRFYAGDTPGAVRCFEKADRQIEENYTKSVSKEVTAAFFNDYVIPYYGEDHESIYVNVFKALAFIKEGEEEKAFVEIRRANEKFKLFSTRYQKEAEALSERVINKDTLKTELGVYPFTDSALARFLGLLLYRAEGSIDDARIDKEKIKKLWNTEAQFFDEGRTPERQHLRVKLAKDSAILNIVAFYNLAPYKRANEIRVQSFGRRVLLSGKNPDFTYWLFFDKKQDISFKFSIPEMVERVEKIEKVSVSINDKFYSNLFLMEDFGKTIMNNFSRRRSFFVIKAFFRSLVKFIAKNEVKKKLETDNLLGYLTSLTTDALIDMTEQADLRCWRLFPEYAKTGEFILPYGTYLVCIDFKDKWGKIVKSMKKEITLNKTNKLNMVTAYGL